VISHRLFLPTDVISPLLFKTYPSVFTFHFFFVAVLSHLTFFPFSQAPLSMRLHTIAKNISTKRKERQPRWCASVPWFQSTIASSYLVCIAFASRFWSSTMFVPRSSLHCHCALVLVQHRLRVQIWLAPLEPSNLVH